MGLFPYHDAAFRKESCCQAAPIEIAEAAILLLHVMEGRVLDMAPCIL